MRQLPQALSFSVLEGEAQPAGWVADDARETANSLLETRQSALLSDQDAAKFGANELDFPQDSPGHWFLLRGIEIAGDAAIGTRDKLVVRAGDGFIWVTTHGNRLWPGGGTFNRPVIVRLATLPDEVYTDIGLVYRGGVR